MPFILFCFKILFQNLHTMGIYVLVLQGETLALITPSFQEMLHVSGIFFFHWINISEKSLSAADSSY